MGDQTSHYNLEDTGVVSSHNEIVICSAISGCQSNPSWLIGFVFRVTNGDGKHKKMDRFLFYTLEYLS